MAKKTEEPKKQVAKITFPAVRGVQASREYYTAMNMMGDFGWAWAVLPETAEENQHLKRFCPNTLFRAMNV